MKQENRSRAGKVELAWLLLVALTFAGSLLGEYGGRSFWIVLLVAVMTAFKGRLVIDHFMELGQALPVIRRVVTVFGLLVPLLLLVTWLWGEELSRLNWLGG